jgi:integrase
MTKKSGQNQGSVSLRKDGSVQAQISIDGKRISKYFKTKREANAWRIETLNKIQNGMFNSGPQVLLSEYLAQWLIASKDSVRPKTHIQYRQIVEQHINPMLGQIKLSDLRPEMIQAAYNNKTAAGTSARTVRLTHSVLRSALNQALRMGLIYRNPATVVYQPKLKEADMKVLDENQVRSFLIAAKGHRLETLFKLEVTSGLREGEILGLKWSDLDWENHQLKVQRQLQRVPGVGLMFSEPKSAAGRRMIMLGSDTIASLKAHSSRQHAERVFAGDKWQENDLIFPSTIGTPLEPRNLFREFKDLLRKASLPDIRFHDLRHSFATLALSQGVSVKVVQEMLGHSDASMTLKVYSHTTPGMQKEAAKKMDEITALIDIGIRSLSE